MTEVTRILNRTKIYDAIIDHILTNVEDEGEILNVLRELGDYYNCEQIDVCLKKDDWLNSIFFINFSYVLNFYCVTTTDQHALIIAKLDTEYSKTDIIDKTIEHLFNEYCFQADTGEYVDITLKTDYSNIS
jgi:hypothetical protein